MPGKCQVFWFWCFEKDNPWCNLLNTFISVVFLLRDKLCACVRLRSSAKKFGGLGELTELGALQQFKLGRLFRKRYNGFISEEYSQEEIVYRSRYNYKFY
uniref:Uncharacterized protein n=1 Tax=Meloidogyne hapla TaxID=6305 RepID=A0A1I8BFX4_MELHA